MRYEEFGLILRLWLKYNPASRGNCRHGPLRNKGR